MSVGCRVVLVAATAFFAVLAMGCPPDFRRRYHDLMLQVFLDCCRVAWRDRGLVGVVAVWLAAVADVASLAPAEWLRWLREAASPMACRWAGPAATLAGILWIGTVLAWIQPDAGHEYPYDGPQGIYAVAVGLFSPSVALMLIGITALHVCRVAGAGWLAVAGYRTTLTGGILVLVTNVVAGWLHLVAWWWSWQRVALPGGVFLFVGLIIFGVAMIRAAPRPHWHLLPFLIGCLGLITFPLTSELVPGTYHDWPTITAWTLFGAGWIVLGRVLPAVVKNQS